MMSHSEWSEACLEAVSRVKRKIAFRFGMEPDEVASILMEKLLPLGHLVNDETSNPVAFACYLCWRGGGLGAVASATGISMERTGRDRVRKWKRRNVLLSGSTSEGDGGGINDMMDSIMSKSGLCAEVDTSWEPSKDLVSLIPDDEERSWLIRASQDGGQQMLAQAEGVSRQAINQRYLKTISKLRGRVA